MSEFSVTLIDMTSIKHIPKSQRPREKLQAQGVAGLTTTELLTIILGSGSRFVPVSILARKIEQKFADHKQVTFQDLISVKGIGLAKAAQILAAIELVERVSPRLPEEVLDSLDKVLHLLSELRFASKEQIVGLYLDARMKLISKELLALGSVNQSIITPRDVFAPIKHSPVVFLILAHNHPSGNPQPSSEDIVFTRNMQQAGSMLGVELLDHVIIAKSHHYSFKQSGILSPLVLPSQR